MADLVRSSTSEEEDPLDACSNLSLFPRTLKSLSISPPLPPQSEDLQQTHTLLQSMPFEVQKEHQEQGNGTSVASEDTNVGVKMNLIANKRERRPGLDRKNRGKFTFKPVMSEAPQNKPTFDGKKYPKPEDYFAEYAKYKNAIREWEKQTGTTVTDTHENQPLRRPRGPGMPGRKRGSYKHTYSDSFLADLKAFEKESSIPSEQNLEKTITADVPTPDREVDDSTVDSDKHLENVLSTLLACSPDKLEGDACVKLLEKHLHLEPIDEQIFSFPEFPDVRRMNSKASGRTPSKGRTALSNIQNLLKEKNTNATRKSSKSPSPNPPEDQFSFPDRHHLLPGDLQSREADLAKDLNVSFRSSVANNADKVITNASPSNVGTVYVASPFNSSVKKSSNEVESDTQSDIHRSHSSLDGNADNCVDDSITKRNSATIEVDADMPTKRNEVDVTMSESEVNRDTRRRENDADINEETTNLLDNLAEYASREGTRSDPFTPEKDGIPNQQDETTKSPNRAPEEYNTMDGSFEHVEDIQGTRGEENEYVDTACGTHEEENENVDTACGTHGEENENVDTACGTQQDVHNASEKQTRKRRKKGCCYHTKKKRSKTVHDKGEGEKQTETSPHENGVKKQTQRKAKEPEDKKQKKTVTREGEIFSRRKSLAAVGTKWESGVRRSTRIRSRPLEYWRGERFLYGRIHESLTTIIGIKYSSPDKNRNENERPALKVKSFVPDEYKHLVDLAALH